jgi:hypothetical protein
MTCQWCATGDTQEVGDLSAHAPYSNALSKYHAAYAPMNIDKHRGDPLLSSAVDHSMATAVF